MFIHKCLRFVTNVLIYKKVKIYLYYVTILHEYMLRTWEILIYSHQAVPGVLLD